MSRRRPSLAGRGLALVLLGLGACTGPDLLPVPPPADLEGMEAPVRAQYLERRRRLDELVSDPNAEDLEVARAFGELGQWYQAYRLLPGAEPAYANARALDPEDPRWPYYQALIDVIQGREEEARQAFGEVLSLRPDDVASRVRLAELELGAGRLDAAESHLKRALALAPDCVRALAVRAQVARERGEALEALALLQRASILQADSPQLRYALALAYRKAGMPQRAAAYLLTTEPVSESEELRMPDPLVAELGSLDVGSLRQVRLARRASAAGRHAAALEHFRAAAEINPDLINAVLGTALELRELGRLDEALEVYRAALERFPDHPGLHVFAATVLVRLGRDEEAEELLRRGLELRPDLAIALWDLSDLLVRRGDFEAALEQILRARSLEPEKVQVHVARRHAALLIRLGRFAEARRTLEEDLGQLGDDRGLTLILARLLATAPAPGVRDGRRAAELARTALRRSPSLDAAEILVMAAAEQRRFADAATCQTALAALAQRAGREDLVPRLARLVDDFRQGRPLRDPTLSTEPPSSVFVDPSTPGCAALFAAPAEGDPNGPNGPGSL